MTKLRIVQRRSRNGASPRQRAALRTLGLRRIGHGVQREETPQLRGNLAVVSHLVSVEEPGA